jgi:hypothetical protein
MMRIGMVEIFADLQSVLLILAGQSLMWISAFTVGALFGLAALLAALRLLRRFV